MNKQAASKILTDYEKTNRWVEGLIEVGADDDIPEDFLDNANLLCKLGFFYQKAANSIIADPWRVKEKEKESLLKYLKYLKQAKKADELSYELDQNIRAQKTLAYLYYETYLSYGRISGVLRRNQIKQHAFLKTDCRDKAEKLYKDIIGKTEDIKSIYYYANLLYLSSNEYAVGNANDGTKKYREKKESHRLQQRVLAIYQKIADEDEKKRCLKIYIKSNYACARLEMGYVSSTHALTMTRLIFGIKKKTLPTYETNAAYEHLLRARNHLLEVIKLEHLPMSMSGDELAKTALKEGRGEDSWNIYYRVGLLCDFLYRGVASTKQTGDEKCAEKAMKYYKFACDIQFVRKQMRMNAGGSCYAFIALMSLYQYIDDKKGFDEIRNKYQKRLSPTPYEDLKYQVMWELANYKAHKLSDSTENLEKLKERINAFEKHNRLKIPEAKELNFLKAVVDVTTGRKIEKDKYDMSNEAKLLLQEIRNVEIF